MHLLPEERRTLDRIDHDLCAAEPGLASQFLIFTRLTADDGRPPDEDLVTSPRRPPRSRSRSAKSSDPTGYRIFLAVLLAALLAMILILTLTGYR